MRAILILVTLSGCHASSYTPGPDVFDGSIDDAGADAAPDAVDAGVDAYDAGPRFCESPGGVTIGPMSETGRACYDANALRLDGVVAELAQLGMVGLPLGGAEISACLEFPWREPFEGEVAITAGARARGCEYVGCETCSVRMLVYGLRPVTNEAFLVIDLMAAPGLVEYRALITEPAIGLFVCRDSAEAGAHLGVDGVRAICPCENTEC